MWRSRPAFCVSALICGVFAAAAVHAEVQLVRSYPNVIVYSTVKLVAPDGLVNCGVVTFDEFDDIPGATNYVSHVYDNGVLVDKQAGGVFPFYGDAFQYVGLHVAPPGRHRMGRTARASQSFDPNCGKPDKNRFVAAGVDVYVLGQPPAARFSFSYGQDDPQRVLFDARASKGNIISYDWDFGDGQFGTGIQPIHRFDGVGTYSVKLTVTNDQGIGDIVRHDVRNDKPLLVYTPLVDPKAVAMGDSFVLELKVKNNGSQPLTGVIPTGPPALASDDGADAQLTGGPQPAGPLSLAPGETQTFAYDYQAAVAGTAVFTAQINGSDAITTMTAQSTCVAADSGCGRVTVTDRKIVVNSVETAALLPAATRCDTGAAILRGGNPEPECTLRAAIEFANGRAGRDYISFDIPNVAGMPSIGDGKLTVTDPVVIDGSTQPGAGRVGLKGTEGGWLGSSGGANLQNVCQDNTLLEGMRNDGSPLILAPGSSGSEIRGIAIYGSDTGGILVTPSRTVTASPITSSAPTAPFREATGRRVRR